MALLPSTPVVRLLDASGDLDLSTGRAQFAAGLVAARQGVGSRILLIRGEWFLNRADGVAYVENTYVTADEALIGAPFIEGKARREFTRAILDAPGVVEVITLAFVYSVTTRRLTVTWLARCSFGGTVGETVEV